MAVVASQRGGWDLKKQLPGGRTTFGGLKFKVLELWVKDELCAPGSDSHVMPHIGDSGACFGEI